MKTLSIIIVSYNTREVLKECLASIAKNVPKSLNYEVLVIDNNSSDKTAEELSSNIYHLTSFRFVGNKENVGFSRANNQGVKLSSGKYVLFLNPDTVVRKDALETVISFMEKNETVGCATCRIELQNGTLDDACHRGFPTPFRAFCHFSGISKLFPKSRLFNGYHMGFRNLSSPHEIDACAGAFMMVRRSAGEEIKWWDEDFFWYGEDLDFCYRLWEKGFRVYFVPNCSILHYKGVAGGIKKHSQYLSTAKEETKKRAKKARFEAMRIFYKKHYEKKYPKIITSFVLWGINLKQALS